MYVHKLDSPLPPIKCGATDKKQRQEQFRGKHPFKIKKKVFSAGDSLFIWLVELENVFTT